MALPSTNSDSETIKDVLEENNTILGDILGRLDEQVNVAKGLADQERLRIENEEFAAVEAQSERRSFGGAGLIGGGAITGAVASAGQGLSNVAGLFPFQGMGALVGGALLATLIYSFRDSITDFIQNEASVILEEMGVGEDLTNKVQEYLKNAAGVGVGASIGRIFGFRGALLGGLLGYIVQDYGLGRLFDDDTTNDSAVLDDFFAKLKEDPAKVGIELGGLLALLGHWKKGLLIGLGSYLFKNTLEKIVTEEGRQELMDGIKSEFEKISDIDLGISDAIGVLTGAFLSTKLVSGIRGGIASIFTRRTPGAAPAPNQAEIDQRLSARTNQIRSSAAQEVLQSVDDADLERAGLRRTAGGGIQGIGRNGSPEFVSADRLSGAVDRFGLNEQFRAAQLRQIPAPPPSAGRKALNVIGKLTKYSSWFLAAGINVYAIYAIWADDQMSDSEKLRQTSYYLVGIGTGALGALAGSIAGGTVGTAVLPIAGTAIGGFVGMTIGGAAGFFAGETLVKYIVDWLTGDSDSGAGLAVPTPEAATAEEAEALVLETGLNNVLNPSGSESSFMGSMGDFFFGPEQQSGGIGGGRVGGSARGRRANGGSDSSRLQPMVEGNQVSSISQVLQNQSVPAPTVITAQNNPTIIDNSSSTTVAPRGTSSLAASKHYNGDPAFQGLQAPGYGIGIA